MRTLEQIRDQIERTSDRRAELWHKLSEGRNPDVADELHELEREIERLWDEQRAVRAAIRFGEREKILRRARTEERIERSAA
ncbi:MAG TPA: hypothetical protein VII05_08905 [Gaiellaceae bacterium]